MLLHWHGWLFFSHWLVQWVGWVAPLLADPFPGGFPSDFPPRSGGERRVGLAGRKIEIPWMFSALLCPTVKASKHIYWGEVNNLSSQGLRGPTREGQVSFRGILVPSGSQSSVKTVSFCKAGAKPIAHLGTHPLLPVNTLPSTREDLFPHLKKKCEGTWRPGSQLSPGLHHCPRTHWAPADVSLGHGLPTNKA